MKPKNIECIIDAHTHLPTNPPKTPNTFLQELSRKGVNGAIILGIPAVKTLLETIDPKHVNKEHEKIKEFLSKYHSNINDFQPDILLMNALKMMTSYGRLCSFNPVGERYKVMAAADLSKDPESLARELEALVKRGFKGFKVISTIFMKHLDDKTVESVFEVAQSHNLPVIVHAGCDPGIWELPGYCKYGDPSRLYKILREHRDVTTIIAHIGSYSYLAPGVFLEETIELVRRFANVYVDTSAVPPQLVGIAAKHVPADKILFGSDYPVINNIELESFIFEVYKQLKNAGFSTREVNKVFWINALNIFGIRC